MVATLISWHVILGFVNTLRTIAMDNIDGWRYHSINATWNLSSDIYFFVETRMALCILTV